MVKVQLLTGLSCRWPISYCRELSGYSIPFLGADVSVVKRTQRYLYESLEQSPVSVYDLFFNKENSVFVAAHLFNVGILCL